MSSIVVPEHFIRATRDTGYRSVAFAIGELIDNALDAKASTIEITVREERTRQDREITIAVLDNGIGMDSSTLWQALRFGGSAQFDDRTRLGRYGMGLPNSSLSQTGRVDVFTWTEPGKVRHTFLDVDEIVNKRRRGVPKPSSGRPPGWTSVNSESGTLIIWSRCDRLRYRKAITIAEKLRSQVGQMFRVALAAGVEITINGRAITSVDPMFRVARPELTGTCERFGDPLVYMVRTGADTLSPIVVQFYELPVGQWHDLAVDTKRQTGIIGGSGMSVLRAGREIDYGWHLFGSKRRENYDDWWRCELRFEPKLDELFGITHSKQGINPTPELRSILEPDVETIARQLNRRVRAAFTAARSTPANRAAVRASRADRFLPPIPSWRTQRRPAQGFSYRICSSTTLQAEFVTVQIQGEGMRVQINENHPFYEKMYKPLRAAKMNDAVDLLILAVGRAVVGMSDEDARSFLGQCSDNLAAFLSH